MLGISERLKVAGWVESRGGNQAIDSNILLLLTQSYRSGYLYHDIP